MPRPTSGGDGRIMAKRTLRCGHGIPMEQQPVITKNGRRWYMCPDCGRVERDR